VQQEINGLLDANHEYKISPEKISALNCKQAGIQDIMVEKICEENGIN
jgi:hypothetical protein